jgi:hypothetical protein
MPSRLTELERRETRTVASVLRFKARVQLAASHLVRAEATVSCRGPAHGSALERMPKLEAIAPPRALYGVRPLGGTRHRMIVCEGWCSCAGWGGMVRRLRTCSDAPSQPSTAKHVLNNTHPGLSFASYDPCIGQ